MWFYFVPEVSLILDNAGDDQSPAAQPSRRDRQMHALIRMNTAKEDKVITTGFLKSSAWKIHA